MTRATSLRDLQLIEAARRLADSRLVVLGSGAAFAVGPLARMMHTPAPRLVIDSGVEDSRLETTIRSVADPDLPSALRMGSMTSVFFELLQAGRVDTAILSAAQIDAQANLNSSYLGDRTAPSRRFPGAGGAPPMVSLCRRTLVLVVHERRRFPSQVDYVTSAGPGHAHGAMGRTTTVVTDLCLMESSTNSPRLQIKALMPGVTQERVQDATDFPIHVADRCRTIDPPNDQEIEWLHNRVDPKRLCRS